MSIMAYRGTQEKGKTRKQSVVGCCTSNPSHAETLVDASGPVGSLSESGAVQSNENGLN